MMVLRRLFIDRFLYVPLRVQLHALRLRCSVPLSMANLREPLYSPNVGEDEFSEVPLLCWAAFLCTDQVASWPVVHKNVIIPYGG
jgi:hypothetical protein